MHYFKRYLKNLLSYAFLNRLDLSVKHVPLCSCKLSTNHHTVEFTNCHKIYVKTEGERAPKCDAQEIGFTITGISVGNTYCCNSLRKSGGNAREEDTTLL